MIRALLDRKLTTVAEIEEVTGRGASTIYRWIRDESEPYASDMRRLVRHVRNPEAQRYIVSQMAADLPLIVTWVDGDDPMRDEFEATHGKDGHDVVDMTLMALDCISELVVQERASIRTEPHLSRETYTRLVELVDTSIRYLTNSKLMMEKYVRDRKRARPPSE